MRSRIAIWLLVLPLVFAAALPAQQRLVTLTKGKLTAVLDTYSGRFAAETVNGTRLLFARDAELTSHISVALDGEIYTNYPKSDINVLWPRHALGRGETQMLSDRIRHTWRLGSRGGERRVILELEPVSDSLYNEVRIHLTVENATMDVISAGMTVMMDVCAGADDKVRLRNAATTLEYERRFAGEELSERLMLMSDAYQPDSAYCRLRGDALTAPDAVTVGRWMYHSALGTAVYGYEATGMIIWDSAVLAQWDIATLPAGQRRTQSTAVGLTGERLHINATGMFATEFMVPILSSVLLSLVSDSIASATITTPYCDNRFEGINEVDSYWDTTVTVTPSKPASVYIAPQPQIRAKVDSITWYRQYYASVQSDRAVGLVIRNISASEVFDGDAVWPSRVWDRQYLFHGIMASNFSGIFMDELTNNISISNTLEYVLNLFTKVTRAVVQVGGSIATELPSKSCLHFQASSEAKSFNHWSPKNTNDKALSIDGIGDFIQGENAFLIANRFVVPLFPGAGHGFHPQTPWQHRYLHQPSMGLIGKHYVFIPFFKPHASKQDDLIRIVASHDQTEVRLSYISSPIRLDRGKSIDTLLAAPTTIFSNHPVAIYQHHLAWDYLRSDTILSGGAFALLPPEMWGTRYHSWTADFLEANIGLDKWTPWWLEPGSNAFYDNLYLIVVTRASNNAGVLINDAPLDAGKFTVFGEYAYAYIDISPGYHIVSSAQPLLTVVCGGGGSTRYGKQTPFGMSWIPPFTSSSGGAPIGPKHDERTGELETHIPRD
jgi:hypothetical protein